MLRFKKEKLSEDMQYITEIVSHFSEKDHVKKMISPLSDEYFLIDDENEVYICLGNGQFTLSNHKFLYRKIFNLSFTDKLKRKVRQSMETEMQALKKSLFKNETDLLGKVLHIAATQKNAQIINHNFKQKAE